MEAIDPDYPGNVHGRLPLTRRWLSKLFVMCLAVLPVMQSRASATISGPLEAELGGHWWYVTWVNDGKDGGPPILGGTLYWHASGGWPAWGIAFTQFPVTCNQSAAGCFQGAIAITGGHNPFRMWQHDGDAGKSMCFGKVDGGGVFYPFVGGQCVYTTPPKPVCTINDGDVYLPHAELTLAQVNGNLATSSATIVCDKNATVNIRAIVSASNLTSTVPLRPDSSITSHLTVNGVDGAIGASVTVVANQPTAVALGSTLASATPTAGALQGGALLNVDTLFAKPIVITGNVIAPLGPAAALRLVELSGNNQSNLGVHWSWSTTPHDYGSTLVPANYSVGFFVRDASASKWSAFRVDSASAPAATWAARMQVFRDKNPQGGVNEPASRVFEAGKWCITTAAASTRETGGTFIEAPGAVESCFTVTKSVEHRGAGSRGR